MKFTGRKGGIESELICGIVSHVYSFALDASFPPWTCIIPTIRFLFSVRGFCPWSSSSDLVVCQFPGVPCAGRPHETRNPSHFHLCLPRGHTALSPLPHIPPTYPLLAYITNLPNHNIPSKRTPQFPATFTQYSTPLKLNAHHSLLHKPPTQQCRVTLKTKRRQIGDISGRSYPAYRNLFGNLWGSAAVAGPRLRNLRDLQAVIVVRRFPTVGLLRLGARDVEERLCLHFRYNHMLLEISGFDFACVSAGRTDFRGKFLKDHT